MNSAGSVLNSQGYDSFGVPIVTPSTDPLNGYGSQRGSYTDHETGLVLMGHRFYDETTGRFVNRDPIGSSGGLNQYRYCENSPFSSFDPFGLCDGPPEDCFSVGGFLFTPGGYRRGLDIGEYAIGHPSGFGDDGRYNNAPCYGEAKIAAGIAWGSALTAGATVAGPYVVSGAVNLASRAGPAILSYLGSGATAAVVATESENPLPICDFSYAKIPAVAENMENAIMASQPQILTYLGPNSPLAKLNRDAATDDIPQIGKLTVDEYPFACTAEGGANTWVGHVPGTENSSQGGTLNVFLRANNLKAGD